MLHTVPFHALILGAQPVAETYRVRYLDRAATLIDGAHGTRPLAPKASCGILGVPEVKYSTHPSLPGVLDELAAVSSHFPGSQPVAEATSKDFVAATSADVLHIACHADLEAHLPLVSRLLFGDRPVFAFEIALLSFAARIVVLSACDTASGPASIGGRIDSLATAFLGAGASEVAATLWPLDDEVAVLCMGHFYRQLRDGGCSAAEAVRAAQRAVRQTSGFEHPYYWAPFIVYGDAST